MSWASRNNVRRLLIANRGEIACRVIKTAKKMGLETIAVYSDADFDALHRHSADLSVYLGPSAPVESYLNIPRILDAAKQANADLIHPGYGFLSENANFAKGCFEHNIRFIGPPVQAIADMGSKSRAKVIMSEAGVPLIPGYHGQEQSEQRLAKEAEDIGFPLLVKAASGGGGKGMRIVSHSRELGAAIASARREALSSFGDPTLLLESYLPDARHVEVQIFFDSKGDGVYLFDRDCSLQRRHQKIIEEAPAPGLSDDLRRSMGKIAVAAGRAIDYEGAGTVEFLLAGDQFYFMEVNTRLQVEHPVSERITGIDLVEWQIRTAVGEPLPLGQDVLECKGHAIETRVYAEDPAQHYLPSTGRLFHLEWPQQDDYIRVDSGVRQGDVISRWYDPMLAKVIGWGRNREEAIDRLAEALGDSYLAGVKSNRDYLLALLNHPAFRAANLSTSFINDYFEAGQPPLSLLQNRQLLAVAVLYRYQTETTDSGCLSLPDAEPFSSYLYLNGDEYRIRVQVESDGYRLQLDGEEYAIGVSWKKEKQGLSGLLHVENDVIACRLCPLPNQQLAVFLPDCSAVIGLPGSQVGVDKDSGDILTAPMNGTVTTVNVQTGEEVKTGTLLLTMEAMKMEYSIKAPRDGVIGAIELEPGDQVESGAALIAYQDTTDDTV